MATIRIANRDIPALWIGLGLPVLAGLYTTYAVAFADDNLMSRNDAVTAKQAAIQQKRNEATELKQRTKQVDQIKRETEALEESIRLLKQKIPSDAEVSTLLFDIERLAKSSQGTLNSFAPGALRAFSGAGANAAATGDIQELPVTIQASATYPEVIKFLQELNAYERKLNVSNLSLAPAGSGASAQGSGEAGKNNPVFKNTLNVEFTLLAYVLKQGGGH